MSSVASWARHRDGYELVAAASASTARRRPRRRLAVTGSPGSPSACCSRRRRALVAAGFAADGGGRGPASIPAAITSCCRASAPRAPTAAIPAPAAPAASTNAPAASTARSCPTGCSRHGNCNALTGECVCAPTHAGAACERPLLPACALGGADDETLNLSWLASSEFWQAMHWVTNNGQDKRRSSPPFRWVGVVPCDCVVQAVQLFSLRASPQPARWPKTIQPHEIYRCGVVCAHTALSAGRCGRRAACAGRTCRSSRGSRAGRHPRAGAAAARHRVEAMYVSRPTGGGCTSTPPPSTRTLARRPLSEMLGVAVPSLPPQRAGGCRGGGWCGAMRRAPQGAAARRRRATALAAATPRRDTSRAAAGGRRTLAAARGAARGRRPPWRDAMAAAFAALKPDEEAAIRAADWAGADVWRWLAPRAAGQKRARTSAGGGALPLRLLPPRGVHGASTAGCRPRAPRGSRRGARRCARASSCASCRRLRRSSRRGGCPRIWATTCSRPTTSSPTRRARISSGCTAAPTSRRCSPRSRG